MNKITVSILFFILLAQPIVAQNKFERESRIKQNEVPTEAMSFINSINIQSKIKWYLEEGIDSKSIEAKFKQNKKRHSVEFDTLGNIEDIEIEIKWNALTKQIQNAIDEKLSTDCLKHKIDKIQTQYSGSSKALLAMMKSNDISSDLNVNYELIVKCKTEEASEQYEYLFDYEGKPLSVSKIVSKNSSHLEY